MKTWIGFLFIISFFMAACHTHDHDHDHSGHDHGDSHEGHDHDEETAIISYTLQEGNIELFLEFKPFVVGHNNQLRAVLTDLTQFKGLEGSLEIHIKNGSKTTASPSSSNKAILGASLSFEKAGNYDLIFVINTEKGKQSLVLSQIPVAKDAHDALHLAYPKADIPGSITFQREQAWKGNFEARTVQVRAVGDIIHTSGTIEPSSSDLSTLVAKCDGVVTIRKKNMTSGTAVRSGELLFTVTGKGIVEDDLEMNFLKAQSNLERQKTSLDRKKALLDDNIIGQKEYDEVLNQYELAEAEFNNVKKLYQKGSNRHLVTNINSGFVSQLHVKEGQFVKAGEQLASILKTSRVQVRVDVSPRFRAMLPLVVDANFVNPYNNKAYTMSELEGKVASFGRMTSHAEGHYIPMHFEINNHPDLSPGALVEAFLLTQPNQERLSLPLSAVLEEMGSSVVFIQKSAESFEKQVIELGANDGKFVQVLNGLKAGDIVVTKGALQIKMASMAGSVDPHAGHVH